MRTRLVTCVVALCLAPPASAQEVLVLQWPGSSIGHSDAKLQKNATKATRAETPVFLNGDVLFPREKARDTRIELIKALTNPLELECSPTLRPHIAEMMLAYAADHSDFWIAIPVEGKANDLAVWSWTSETSTFARIDKSCV